MSPTTWADFLPLKGDSLYKPCSKSEIPPVSPVDPAVPPLSWPVTFVDGLIFELIYKSLKSLSMLELSVPPTPAATRCLDLSTVLSSATGVPLFPFFSLKPTG